MDAGERSSESGMAVGDGRRIDQTCADVYRNETTSEDGTTEDMFSESSSGEEDWDPVAGNDVLQQRRYAYRRTLLIRDIRRSQRLLTRLEWGENRRQQEAANRDEEEDRSGAQRERPRTRRRLF